MIDYKIVIPTYKRYEILKSNTLELLGRYRINPKKIFIFVANKTEGKKYKNVLNEKSYNEIIVGVRGLKNQRNFINKYFDKGEYIIQMDDDLQELYELIITNTSSKQTLKKRRPNKNYKLQKLRDLHKFILNAYKLLKKNNLFLWGVYPVANAFFMSPNITTDLRFIVGPFWGFINRHDTDLVITVDEKENTERTIKYYLKDKGVLRFNNITIKTNYYSNPGGLQAFGKDRKKEAMKAALYLTKKYPELTKLKLNKKSGVPEVVLSDKKNKKTLKNNQNK